MADEVAKLGFDIDTRSLLAAALAAEKAALSIGKVGQATEQTGKAAQQAKGPLESFGQGASIVDRHVMALAMRMAPAQGGLLSHFGSMLSILPRIGALFGAVGVAAGSMAGAVGGVGLAYAALNLATYAAQDAQSLFLQRMRNALGDVSSAQRSISALRDVARETGASFSTMGEMFLRVARNADTIGASNAELLQLTETITKVGIISGASQGELQSGMIQLGQALASGRLNGDELRSVMEQMPSLARAIADGLGVSVGRLREMGAAGQLTSDRVFRAILSQTERIRQEFATLPQTVERATTRMTDAWERLKASLGERLGASENVRSVVDMMTSLIDWTREATRSNTIDENIRDARVLLDLLTRINAFQPLRERAASNVAQLEEQRRIQQRQAFRSVELEQERVAAAPITRGLNVAREVDDLREKQEKLQQQSVQLATAIRELNRQTLEGSRNFDTFAGDAETLGSAMTIVQQSIEDAATSFVKFNRETQRLREDAQGGPNQLGSRTEAGARQMYETARREGRPITMDEAREAQMNRQIEVAGAEEIRQADRRANAQLRMNEARSRGVRAMADEAVSQRLLNYQYEHFGNSTLPKVLEHMRELEEVWQRESDNDLAGRIADASEAVTDAIASARAQLAALPGGEYATRRAAADASARAQSRGSGVGVDLQMQQFDEEERLRAAQSLVTVNRELEDIQLRMNNAGNPAALRAGQERLQIERAILNVAGSDRPALAAAMRAKFDAERQATAREMVASSQQQLDLANAEYRLIGLSSEEHAVQVALLRQTNTLREAGIGLQTVEGRKIMENTEALARRNFEAAEAQKQAAEVERIWTVAAEGIQNALTDAFEEAFTNGVISGEKAMDILGNLAKRMLSQILSATVFTPMESIFKQLGSSLSDVLGSAIAGGLPNTGPVVSAPNIPAQAGSPSPFFSFGLHEGGVVGRDGNVRYVPMSVFQNAKRYHNGGYIGADEVPIIAQRGERVLTQGQQAGMGTNVIINDMRGTGSPPVEQKDRGQGIDGRRMIEITVRDQTRKLIRSGEIDRDMAASYGASRKLTRR